MAAYRWVYDSRHLQADGKELGSIPEPYTRQSSMGCLGFLLRLGHSYFDISAQHGGTAAQLGGCHLSQLINVLKLLLTDNHPFLSLALPLPSTHHSHQSSITPSLLHSRLKPNSLRHLTW